MAGIYIHIPFCKKLCNYCSFYSSMSLINKDVMLEALIDELYLKRDFIKNEHINTLYIGGGTPTVYSPYELQRLADVVKQLWGVSEFEEFTIEANPDDLTPNYLEELAGTDVNRLSIGVQSFNDEILKFLNRRHSGEKALKSIKEAKNVGIDKITIDLIYGIQNQTSDILKRDIDKALSLDIGHISAYHLTIEENSIFGKRAKKGEIKEVDESISEEHYNIIHTKLTESGYDHYEVSNFAKEGARSVHNSNYWKSVPYIGIGPSAHSYNGDRLRQWNINNNNKYIDSIKSGANYFENEFLTGHDLVNEMIMVSLRTIEGLDMLKLRDKFGDDMVNTIMDSANVFIDKELIVADSSKLYIRPSNFLLSDYIISSLFID